MSDSTALLELPDHRRSGHTDPVKEKSLDGIAELRGSKIHICNKAYCDFGVLILLRILALGERKQVGAGEWRLENRGVAGTVSREQSGQRRGQVLSGESRRWMVG